MSPLASQPKFAFETHRNHFLFSNYYLDTHTHRRPEWQAVDVQAKLEAIAGLWQQFTPQSGNESRTRSAWVRPVLEALGHIIDVQSGGRPPDYIFFPDETARDVVRAPQDGKDVLEERDPRCALAVGVAKAWDQLLDQPTRLPKSGKISKTPSLQIDFCMRHTGRPWGILTNGRHWRLYHHDTSKKLDVYYEVDLVRLIEQATASDATPQQIDAFKFFSLFFRRKAFIGDPPWLDLVLEESRAYEQAVSDNLKEQIYEALRMLAQGFLDFPGNDLEPAPETLKTIYANSLIILYRLLFILYAEDRGLLPLDENTAYAQSYSLFALKRQIADDLQRGTPAVPSMDMWWGQLHRLWHVLNAGNDDLGVPAYNGGLFDPEKYPFLEQHRVGDSHLRRAVDLLARAKDPSTGRREFVDYRDLEIRHLGSIYEGLLECHLEIGDQRSGIEDGEAQSPISQVTPVAATRALPQSPTSNSQPLRLVTDRGERKATGSYYTPDYIVQHIVKHTVGPVLDEVKARYTDEAGNTTDEAALARDILALNVLDPAMGSGHFLVAATDYIARYLVAFGPIPLRGAEGEGASELAYWRRQVVQACIYGVDVNPLAVELSKLSLWLATMVRGKPLSFLDHHLRSGNSLIGARVGDLLMEGVPKCSAYQERKAQEQQEDGQLSMLGNSGFVASMGSAVDFMGQIEALASETVNDVYEAERIYQETVRGLTHKYRTLADVWTARHFGLELNGAAWAGLVQHVLREEAGASQYSEIIEQARKVAEGQRFFHWELEFPEVFFGEHGWRRRSKTGFDAVIGNPPYQFGENIPQAAKPFLEISFELARNQYDIYWLFYDRVFQLIGENGCHGFIIPDAFLARDEVEILREPLLEEHTLRQVSPVGAVFEAPNVSAAIIVWQNSDPTTEHKIEIWYRNETKFHKVREYDQRVLSLVPGYRLWVNLGSAHLDMALDILTHFAFLGTFVQISRGEELGKKDLVDLAGASSDCVPILTGDDIRPLHFPVPSRCVARSNIRKPDAIYKSPKIVLVKTGVNLNATVDNEGYYTLQSVYNLALREEVDVSEYYLAALLKSKLLSHILWVTVTSYKGVFPQINQSNVEALPIRPIEFTTPADIRTALLEEGRRLYDTCIRARNQNDVLGFVEDQLAREPERTDVVHDLLAFLAKEMVGLHKQRQRLEKKLTPFKFLDRGVEFVQFSEAFIDEIKQGGLVQTFEVSETSKGYELGAVHHDIDGLRLVPAGLITRHGQPETRFFTGASASDGLKRLENQRFVSLGRPETWFLDPMSGSEPAGDQWLLEVQLKKRDPASNWRAWQYSEDGNHIAREWVPAYCWLLDDEKAHYYQHAFQVLGQFANAKPFPGGYTRTTLKKLQLARVPAFDPDADLSLLVELSTELAGVRDRIAQTDTLIDEIVYRLYELTAEEITVVEGKRECKANSFIRHSARAGS